MDIQYVHNRKYVNDLAKRFKDCTVGGIASRGGETVAMQALEPWFIETLVPGDFFTKQVGFARCSDEENYNKKTGRELAKSRMKNMVFTVVSNNQYSSTRILVLQDEKGRLYGIQKNSGAQRAWLVTCE